MIGSKGERTLCRMIMMLPRKTMCFFHMWGAIAGMQPLGAILSPVPGPDFFEEIGPVFLKTPVGTCLAGGGSRFLARKRSGDFEISGAGSRDMRQMKKAAPVWDGPWLC